MDTKTPSPIEKAAAIAGCVANLAQKCGVTPQAVYKWIAQGYPPSERCVEVESAVQGQVSRFDLLPPEFHASADYAAPEKPPTQ